MLLLLLCKMNQTNFILYGNRMSKLRESENTPTFRNTNFFLLSIYNPGIHWNRYLCVHPLPILKKIFTFGKVLSTKLGWFWGVLGAWFCWLFFCLVGVFLKKKKQNQETELLLFMLLVSMSENYFLKFTLVNILGRNKIIAFCLLTLLRTTYLRY